MIDDPYFKSERFDSIRNNLHPNNIFRDRFRNRFRNRNYICIRDIIDEYFINNESDLDKYHNKPNNLLYKIIGDYRFYLSNEVEGLYYLNIIFNNVDKYKSELNLIKTSDEDVKKIIDKFLSENIGFLNNSCKLYHEQSQCDTIVPWVDKILEIIDNPLLYYYKYYKAYDYIQSIFEDKDNYLSKLKSNKKKKDKTKLYMDFVKIGQELEYIKTKRTISRFCDIPLLSSYNVLNLDKDKFIKYTDEFKEFMKNNSTNPCKDPFIIQIEDLVSFITQK